VAYNPNFTSSPIGGEVTRLAALTFTYTGDVVPAVVGYVWNFGDGTVSTDAAPVHYWRQVGTYDVSLTAIYDDGAQHSITKTAYVTIVADDLDDYLDLLLTQYRRRPRLEGLLAGPIDQGTLVANAAQDLTRTRDRDVATGILLDDLGDLLGLTRLGYTDAEYRAALGVMPEILRGYGSLDAVIRYVQRYLDPEYLTALEGDMRVYVDAVGHDPQNYRLLRMRLERLAAAGVRVDLVVNEEVPLEFEYTDEPPLYVSGNEFSEPTYYDGGYISESITT